MASTHWEDLSQVGVELWHKFHKPFLAAPIEMFVFVYLHFPKFFFVSFHPTPGSLQGGMLGVQPFLVQHLPRRRNLFESFFMDVEIFYRYSLIFS